MSDRQRCVLMLLQVSSSPQVNAESIRESLCTSKLKIKPKDCSILSSDELLVHPGVSGKTTLYYHLQFLKEKIGSVVIKGLSTVSRAVIHMDDASGVPKYKLFVEGDNLREVLATRGVKAANTTSNNTCEVRHRHFLSCGQYCSVLQSFT